MARHREDALVHGAARGVFGQIDDATVVVRVDGFDVPTDVVVGCSSGG